MRLRAVLALMFALSACQTAPPEPTPPSYHLIDLSDDYTAFFDRTQSMEAPARVAAFKATFEPLFPGFYDIERQPWVTQERLDARIARSFERFPAQRERYTQTAANFERMLAPALDSFVQAFPDSGAIGDIYLLHSLGEMDGGTRTIAGANYFVFGADVMAVAHTWPDDRPFFHHELFHVYHQHAFGGCEQLWCSIWMEGLAVEAALTLNPNATDDELLLNLPEPIRAAVDANRTEAVCAVKARLQSTSEEDANAVLSFGRLNERLPPRFGYYVGYLIAREAARTQSLRQLAHLDMAAARPVMDAAMARLADCPSPAAH